MGAKRWKPAFTVGKSWVSWAVVSLMAWNGSSMYAQASAAPSALTSELALPEIPEEIAALPVDLDGDGASTFGDKMALSIWCEMGGDLDEALGFAVPEGDVLSLQAFFASLAESHGQEPGPEAVGDQAAAQGDGEWFCGGSAQYPCYAILPDHFPQGTTIQEAIDSLPDGAVLCIRPDPAEPDGMWRENVLIYLKEITLRALPDVGQDYVSWAPARPDARTITVDDGVVAIQGFRFVIDEQIGMEEGVIQASFTSLAYRDLCVERCYFDYVVSQTRGGAAIGVDCYQGGSPGSTAESAYNTFDRCQTFVQQGEDGGGAVSVLGGLDSFQSVYDDFEDCYSAKMGGALYAGGSETPESVSLTSAYINGGESEGDGGGLWIKARRILLDGSYILYSTTIASNSRGGGAYLAGSLAQESSIEIHGCSFSYNRCSGLGDLYGGAGLFLTGTVSEGIQVDEGTTFFRNQCQVFLESSGFGAGVYLDGVLQGPCTFERALFDRNGLVESGYGCGGGGAIYVAPGYQGPLWIKRCRFLDNQVSAFLNQESHGAAIHRAAPETGQLPAHISNSFFFADEGDPAPAVSWKEFIYIGGDQADVHIFNSTLRKVNAEPKGIPEHIDIDLESSPTVRLTNDILWTDDETGNMAFDPNKFPPDRVHNNDVRYLSDLPEWPQYQQTDNIDQDPVFVAGTGYRIDSGSPCADAGTAASGFFDPGELDELGIDLDEENRFWPVDMGADESLIVETFIRGDANGDGVVDIGDPIYLLNYLQVGGPPPQCMDAGDANDDGSVDIGDPIYLLNYLQVSGPEPPPPFPDCGPDPTADDLDCSKYPPHNCE